MRTRTLSSSALLLACGLLLIVSCSKTETPAPPPTESVIASGVLTYAAGDVAVQNGSVWVPIDIGDSVDRNAVVRTGKQSACDIQFGQFGVVHLSESTTLALKTVAITARRKVLDVELVVGTVAAKVSKLTGADRFQIRTDTVTCGVRGTRFVVTRMDSTQTTVAVAEGRVGLMPPSYDPQALDQLSVSTVKDSLVQTVEAKILSVSPSVEVGGEVVVTKASMDEPSAAVVQLQTALAATSEATAASDQVNAAFSGYERSLSPALAVSRPPSPQSQKTFAETAGLKILETVPAKADSDKSDPTPTARPQPSIKPVVLSKPRALYPAEGQTIDIVKNASITFRWKPVSDATGYEVSLYLVKDPSRNLVKTWTTSDVSAVLDKFDDLQAGTFDWEVRAVRGTSEKGPAADTRFHIVKGSVLPAPSLELSGNSPNAN